MLNPNERDVNAKTIEVAAKTVDEAIEQGLTQLAAQREQVDIEVLREGKRGVFGLGSEEALVRLTLRMQAVAEAAAPAGQLSEPKDQIDSPATPDPIINPISEEEHEEEDDDDELFEGASSVESGVAEIAIGYLQGLLKGMGIEATVTARVAVDLVEPGEEPPLVLDVTGSDLGILIGRRSETLRALQYMVRLMVSKQMSRWQPIVIDVESYRVRRRNSLYQLAEKMAERAVSSRRKVIMEAMPAYERRIIHIALRNHPGVITKSVGSDDNRKVTILPK